MLTKAALFWSKYIWSECNIITILNNYLNNILIYFKM